MKKIFHISDLVSVHLGKALSLPEEMQMPDGSTRPAYNGPVVGTMQVIEHLTGNSCDSGTPLPSQVNMLELVLALPAAKRALYKQHPWLEGVTLDKNLIPKSPDECLAFLREWFKGLAKKHGGEWFALESGIPEEGLKMTSSVAMPHSSPCVAQPPKRTLH